MTYLRSASSAVDYEAFQPSRRGALVSLRRPANARLRTQVVSAVLFAALGPIVALLRYRRQVVEARRAQRHLMQLDDHLLRDIGLSRSEARFGNFTALAERRKSHRN
jgi:uncharacterized protein YjiS (DUF1127 family)